MTVLQIGMCLGREVIVRDLKRFVFGIGGSDHDL